MLPRVEHFVTVPVTVETAFQVFLDLDRLLHRGIYEEAAWIQGTPWQVGSRVRYVIVNPVQATVSAVVTSINPPHSLSLLNHGLGVTVEQHVYFSRDVKGGTRVRVTMDLVGKAFDLSDSSLADAATFILKDGLDSVVESCRRLAS
jgi:hypothetical protein